MILGSHLSTAGGLDRPLRAAADYGFEAVGLFVRNQVRWAAPPLTTPTVRLFRKIRRRTGLAAVVAHATYLANLASEQPELHEKSVEALSEEMGRCARLGIEFLVVHPGSCADVDAGIARVASAVRRILRRTPGPTRLLLETTAGAGHTLGRSFEQLQAVFDGVGGRFDRIGACLDTCHAFAAGYDLRTPERVAETLDRFDATVGLARLGAIHLNDSVGALGSRRDRHAHVGKGKIGRRGFGAIVSEPRLAGTPMILETPKGQDPRGRDWDTLNARLLRRLAGQAKP